MEDGASRIQEVEFSHERSLREINSLLHRFRDQMKMSRRREQEKLRVAFSHLREEIEEERNMCRLLKLQNKKLLKELEEANVAATDAGEELHRERRARELMEEVCNELAREIGEDKAEVEQLKHEHAKSRELVEQELKMMRMASLWKDERVKTKILEVQSELDEREHTDLPVPDLKSRVEEFVSTLSVTGRESYNASTNIHTQNKDEKQKKNIIEQARLLRCALEFSMREVAGNEEGSQVQASMDLEDEKIVTPFIEEEQNQTNVCECCSDKMHECVKDESCDCLDSCVDYAELRERHGDCMFNHPRKSCKHLRQPETEAESDLFDHNADMIKLVRKQLYDGDAHSELECGSKRTIFDSKSVKKTADQKQSSFCLQSSQRSPEMNADVWEDDATLSSCRLNCYAEDDTSQARMDDAGGFSMREHCRRCPASYGCTAEEMDAMYLWKSPPSSCQEHPRMDDDQIDQDTQFSMHHYVCKDANSVCADGANSCEGELREFDGFYFEPVMGNDSLLGDDCRVHHGEEPDVNACAEAADHEDEHKILISKSYGRCAQQSRSSKELAHNSLSYDGVKWTNAKPNGISSIASRRDDGVPPSLPPPHKLVLPNLNAIRASSGKSHYIPRRSAARSVSPGKAQVLQCFRPSPLSPEHEFTNLLVSESSKGVANGEGVEGQHSGGSSNGRACLRRPSFNKRTCSLRREEGEHHVNMMHLDEVSGSKTEISEEKGNTLRAELLRARELDLLHTNCNVNSKATAPSPNPNQSSSPSSVRFSPLRRSLTTSSQAGH